MNRRSFLGNATVGAAALAASETLLSATAGSAEAAAMPAMKTPPLPHTVRRGEMPYRALGKTGEMVSLVGLGGFHIGKQTEEAASIRIIHAAIDNGINFMDNCWDYHEGLSELRMGKALQGGRRDKVFLMTKIDGRPKSVAAKQIDESLARLRTDHVDLLQFHEILRYEDPDRIFAPDGAIHAAIEAQKAGKVRFIGFTGHKNPNIHLEMFKVADAHGFHFDTVQHPVNVFDAHFRSFIHNVMPVAAAHGTASLGMKTFGDHFILSKVQQIGAATPVQMLHFGMSQPVSVLITGIDSLDILNQALTAARTFQPMTQGEQSALLAKTKDAAMMGKYELFKTSEHFDSTAQHPEWLGNKGN